MSFWIAAAIGLLAAYLLGSIPSGYLAGRLPGRSWRPGFVGVASNTQLRCHSRAGGNPAARRLPRQRLCRSIGEADSPVHLDSRLRGNDTE